MLLQYASDLHLEFLENKAFLKKNPLQLVGEILVLAGDIVPFYQLDRHKDFFNWLGDHFAQTYWLPGNHEYYHSDIMQHSGRVQENIRSNVTLVNNVAVQHGPVRILFSTLWTYINPAHEWQIERSMSDFQVIRKERYLFSTGKYNQLHEQALSFVKEELAKPFNGPTVVATHHVPTYLHYPEQYKGDLLNEAFAVELFPFIETSGIHYWLYGHHHSNTPPFTIGQTTLLTNQLGYVHCGEHVAFNSSAVIDVNTPPHLK